MRFRSHVIIAISSFFLITTATAGAIREENLNTQSDFNEYTNQSPPPGIDLDVTYISREPRYEWDSPKNWPDQGESVTFEAHIINKGTIDSGSYSFEWRIDNQIVATSSASSIPPQGENTQQIKWDWQAGGHGTMAGGQVPLADQKIDRLVGKIEQRLLNAMGEKGKCEPLLGESM